MSLNKAFLEKALNQSISDFVVSEGAKLGDNVAGSLKCVKVTATSGKNLNLVYKGLPEDEQAREYATRFGIFRTETTLYTTIRSKVEALLKTRGAKRTDLPMPKFFGGQFDGDHTYILLEDVRPQGYIMPDKFKGLSPAEVTVVMKEIARFHASTYFWIKFEGEKVFDDDENLTWIRDSVHSKDDKEMEMIGTLMFTNELRNTVKILSDNNHADWTKKLQELLDGSPDQLYKLVRRTSKLTDKQMFPCIIHGDLWGNNLLLSYDSQSNPTGVRFVDFQQSRRGNVIEELEYFFLCSTTPSFRKDHLHQALNTYYDSFVATLAELRCPVPIGFTRGGLIDTFHEGLLPAYLYMTFAIPLQLADPVDFAAMEQAAKSQNGEQGNPDKIPVANDQNGLSMQEMMVKNFAMRSQMMYMQMMKSPKAVDRLLDLDSGNG